MSEEIAHHADLSRRSFLKTSAAVGSAALAGSATTGLAAADPRDEDSSNDRYYSNTCRGNCSCWCPLKVTVREGKVVHVMPQDYPEEERQRYQRACAKGLANTQRIYDPNRL